MKKVEWVFADGTKSVAEVDDALALEIAESRRKEVNYERKTRYWVKVSLDNESNYEGVWYESKDPAPSKCYDIAKEQERVDAFLETLTEIQRGRLLMRMCDPKLNLSKIARIEGTVYRAIHKCFNLIKKEI